MPDQGQPKTAPADDPRLQAVVELFRGRYDVERSLPWNGLALVFQALEPGRKVAVAVLPLDAGQDPAVQPTFERNVELLESIEHHHLLEVTDSGIQHGVPYLEFDFVEGHTLREVLERGPVAGLLARRLAGQVLDALAHAHEAGACHGDLTPSNIVLTEGDEGPEVRIFGLGIAPLLAEARDTSATGPTGRGSGPKATRYLAPELRLGVPADAASDVYSVAALLRHMITGEVPPSARDPEADVSEGVALSLGVLLERGMAEDPGERFENAADMRKALDALDSDAFDLPADRPPVAEAPAPRAAPGRSAPGLSGGGEVYESFGPSASAEAADANVVVPQAAGVPAEASALASEGRPGETASEGAAAGVTAPFGPNTASVPRQAPVAASREPTGRELAQMKAARRSRWPLVALVALIAAGAGGWFLTRPQDPSPEASDRASMDAASTSEGGSAAGSAPDPAPSEGPGESLPDPLAGTLPPLLAEAEERLAEGERIRRGHIKKMYEYANRVGDHDPRVHLVLAHSFMEREWYSDAIERYVQAYEVDPTSRGDPRMLEDLVFVIKRTETLGEEAADALVKIFGKEAEDALIQALREEQRPLVRRRIEKLQLRLRHGSRSG